MRSKIQLSLAFCVTKDKHALFWKPQDPPLAEAPKITGGGGWVVSLTNSHLQATTPPRKQTLEKGEREVWPVAVCAETAPLALLAQQNLGLLSQQPQSSGGLAGWGEGGLG